MIEIAGNDEAGEVYLLPASHRKSVTLAPRSRLRRPPALSGRFWRRAGVTPPRRSRALLQLDWLEPTATSRGFQPNYIVIGPSSIFCFAKNLLQ